LIYSHHPNLHPFPTRRSSDLQMAKKFNGEIYLLHMLELPMQLIGTGSAVGGTSHNLPEAIYFMKLAKKRFFQILREPYLKDIKVERKSTRLNSSHVKISYAVF